MNVGWFFIFTFLLLIHNVVMQDTTNLDGVKGDSVILPCVSRSSPQKVYWLYKDITTVCDISDGLIGDVQEAAYKARVEIFSSEIQKGNFSIRLKNVTEADEGTYTCLAPNRFKFYVQLNVTEGPGTAGKQEIQTTTQNQDTTGRTGKRSGDLTRQADRLLTFLLACALLYSLVF